MQGLTGSRSLFHWKPVGVNSSGSSEEGVAEGVAASHRPEPPFPAPLHRVSRTARHLERQVTCSGLPTLQQEQSHTLTTNDAQSRLSSGQAAVRGENIGRTWAVLHQHQPSSLGRCGLCRGPDVALEGTSLSLPQSPLCGAGTGSLPWGQ